MENPMLKPEAMATLQERLTWARNILTSDKLPSALAALPFAVREGSQQWMLIRSKIMEAGSALDEAVRLTNDLIIGKPTGPDTGRQTASDAPFGGTNFLHQIIETGKTIGEIAQEFARRTGDQPTDGGAKTERERTTPKS